MHFRIPDWTPITWLFGFTWLFLALWGNAPFLQPHPNTNPQYDLRGYMIVPSKMKQPLYDYTAIVEWPVAYIQIDRPNDQVNWFSPLALIWNFFWATLAILAVTYLSQRWLKTFSVKHLLAFTAVAALLTATLPKLLPDWGLLVFIYGMLVVFLAPVFVCAILLSVHRLGNQPLKPASQSQQHGAT